MEETAHTEVEETIKIPKAQLLEKFKRHKQLRQKLIQIMKSRDEVPVEIEEIIRKRDPNTGEFKVYKYSPKHLVSLINEIIFIRMEQKFQEFYKEQVDLLEFIDICLECVPFETEELEYAIIGLEELFNEIMEKKQNPFLTWTHFTTFIIENVIETQIPSNVITSKYISRKKLSNFTKTERTQNRFTNIFQSKQINQLAPLVIGGSAYSLRRFSPSFKLRTSTITQTELKGFNY